MPRALSKVNTMPPTMMTLSAFSSSVLMTSILDDTCIVSSNVRPHVQQHVGTFDDRVICGFWWTQHAPDQTILLVVTSVAFMRICMFPGRTDKVECHKKRRSECAYARQFLCESLRARESREEG